jgi:transposase
MFGVNEMKRALVLEKVIANVMSVSHAATELDLSYRQTLRIKKDFIKLGPNVLRHKNEGKTPKHAVSSDTKRRVLSVFMDWKNKTDDGLNAAHLADILLRDYNLKISRQTSWRILKENGLQIKTRKVRKFRKRRERREQMGDILYLDGSPHHWFGEKHPKATLVLCSDDATTKALWAVFVEEENRNACLEVAYEVFTRYGLPMSFWLDRASQFITTRGTGVRNPQSELPTHWQNAMYNLGIRNIFAHSPQARGRGERANGTFQDRLCSEFQYRNISDLKEATDFVNKVFIPEYNKKFSVEPKNQEGIWRKPPEGINLKHVLCARTDRKVHNDNTVKHNGRKFQLLRKPKERTYAGRVIEVQDWFDGSVHIVFKSFEEIPFTEIATEPRYKKIEGLKKNTILSDVYRSTYF